MIASDQQNRKQELQVFSSELEIRWKDEQLVKTPPTQLSFDGKGQRIGWRKLFKPQWYIFGSK